ncbi:hypothetical protein SAMN05216553_103362 [Lentzea fradiae]|uniref:Peptidase inhibitor family I36 n=1 Tax=Lentzea fradiae TaxID=200378 RepID=A0A1G7P1Y4_9PSEU|nr:hypothetical protein [Lentzea fradiae]SDF80316.1 hypothetical protein SAMN05216553_103362 [Lentzea fradiae]
MRKILAAGAIAAAVASLLGTGTAQAETNPACPSAKQIGSTVYVKNYDETVASVKQYAGCGKNYSYVYVWDSWLSSRGRDFVLTTYIESGGLTYGYKTGSRGQRELWSNAANTIDRCTRAYGEVNGSSYFLFAKTGQRC